MRLIGNILWHIPFGGFLTAIVVFLIGSLLTLLVVTAPIGLGLLQYSKFLLLPYSYDMVPSYNTFAYRPYDEQSLSLWQSYSFFIRILYFPIGLIISFCTLLQVIGLAVSIVGIPVAIPLAKSLHVIFNPVGKVCVPHQISGIIEQKKAEEEFRKYMNK